MMAIEELMRFLPDGHTAALLTDEISCRYLSGFSFTDGAVLVTRDDTVLLTDARYIEAARRQCPEMTVKQFDRLYDTLNEIFFSGNITTVWIEEDAVTLSRFSQMQKRLSVTLDASASLSEKLSSMRMVKSAHEIACIERAQRITERAYTQVLNYLAPGVEERRIAVEFEHLVRLYGGERVAFDPICIAGVNTSLPHGVPTDNTVREGDFFTFDIGAVVDGYHSDMTRTVAIGHATDRMRAVYDIVLSAQDAAMNAIRPMSRASDIDCAARSVIEQHGYGAYFGHATGHGVGLEIHERPAVSSRCDTPLSTNMVITDEPGIYLPGEFGVRIEDTVVVTDTGARSLSLIPKELEIL